MNIDHGKPIPLRGAKRVGVNVFGILFLSLPVAAYLDVRLGLLGTTRNLLEPFGLVMGIFVVLGGVLLVSGVIGMWLMWKDVSPLNDLSSPDPDRITTVEASTTDQPVEDAPKHSKSDARSETVNTTLEERKKPPFDGEQRQVDLLEVDREFTEAAKSYYEENISKGRPFSSIVKSVWRSSFGRPNYYFEIQLNSDEIRWIRVPHRGKAGSGAGTARE